MGYSHHLVNCILPHGPVFKVDLHPVVIHVELVVSTLSPSPGESLHPSPFRWARFRENACSVQAHLLHHVSVWCALRQERMAGETSQGVSSSE